MENLYHSNGQMPHAPPINTNFPDGPSPQPSSVHSSQYSSNRSSVPPMTLEDREWESSPMFLALSGRMARTESSLANLSSQVSQLTMLVKAALPHPQSASTQSMTSPASAQASKPFAPFDDTPPIHPYPNQQQPPPSSGALSAQSGASSSTQSMQTPQGRRDSSDSTIAALTQQITALSTSVAQLQRLQQSQSHISRQNSFTQPPNAGAGHDRFATGPTLNGLARPHVSDLRGLQSGPMTTPAGRIHAPVPGLGTNNGPHGKGLPNFMNNGHGNHHGARDFSPPIRPHTGRSVSTNTRFPGGLGGPLSPNGGTEGTGHPTFSLNNAARDWSPGPSGLTGPNGQGLTPGGALQVPNGPNTPGVIVPNSGTVTNSIPGSVVTKWDQLNLNPDLVRSIAKYGIGPPNKIQARVLPFMLKGSDVIAQAPPTQERIISYVVPALQTCLTLTPPTSYRGPSVIVITTTVDQATQCHKLVRNIGGPLGVRSALATGVAGSASLPNEIAGMQQDAIHLLIGTPAKINEVITSTGGLSGSEVRLLILDEVDQLIARNLYENVLNVAKHLPSPWRGGIGSNMGGTGGGPLAFSPGASLGAGSPFDPGQHSPFNPASKTPFPGQTGGNGPSRFGAPGTAPVSTSGPLAPSSIERQTCLFSNTIPTDVINFSQSLQVRDPVRVLVRREGGPNSQESVSSVTPGINLKHTYVYLTITGSARSDAPAPAEGPGAIGSGRNTNGNGQIDEEANKAKDYKLDTLVKMLEDYPLWQAIIHVGTFSMLEAVVFKLTGRQWDTLYLSSDMQPAQKKAILQKWRMSMAGNGPRFLVIFDVAVRPPEIPWSPLVINFDLPRSVEGYAQRAAAALPPTNRNGTGQSVNGVIVSFVQAAGGDVEMLRSTECAYRFKSAEIPASFRDLFQH